MAVQGTQLTVLTALLAGSDPTELCVLRVFALLAPDPVDREMWSTPAAAEVLEAAAAKLAAAVRAPHPRPVDQALARLQDMGLLKTSTSSDGAAMLQAIPEVRDTIGAAIPGAEARDWVHAALRLVDGYAHEDSDDPRRWPLYRRLAAHIESVLERAEAHAIADPTGPLMGGKLGVFVFLQGHRERAQKLFRRALDLDEAHFGPDHAQVATDLDNLSIAIDGPDAHAESEAMIARAVTILLSQEAEYPGRLAIALGVLAEVFKRRAMNEEVERIYRQALGIDEQHLGKQHPAVARDLRHIASFWIRQGRVKEAAPLVERATAIDERDDPEGPNLATDLQMLAFVCAETDPTADGLALLDRAVAIDDRWYGLDSTVAVRNRLQLAQACAARGQTDRARRALQSALECTCRFSAPDPSLVKGLLDRVNADVAAGGDYEPELLLRVLSSASGKWQSPFTVVQRARWVAVEVLRSKERWMEARRIALTAEEAGLREKLERSASDAQAWADLGLFLKTEGASYDEAERCYRRALERAPQVPRHSFNLGLFLSRCRGQHDAAEELMRRAVEELGDKAPTMLSGLAFFLHHERGKPDEAESLYRRALAASPHDASIATHAASLYLLQGRAVEARALLERAAGAAFDREITLRTLFLGAVAARLCSESPSRWIGRIRDVLRRGHTGSPWNPRALIARLGEFMAPDDARFLTALQAFLFPLSGCTVSAADLEQFALWKTATPAIETL